MRVGIGCIVVVVAMIDAASARADSARGQVSAAIGLGQYEGTYEPDFGALMLTAEGLSASLQHYDNLIIDTVRATWNIPENWALISQMPYGIADEEPGEREFIPFGQMARFEG